MPEQGVNWKIISERLGHGSVAMTLDLYAHASPGLQQAAAQCFDKVLESDSNVSETDRDVPSVKIDMDIHQVSKE